MIRSSDLKKKAYQPSLLIILMFSMGSAMVILLNAAGFEAGGKIASIEELWDFLAVKNYFIFATAIAISNSLSFSHFFWDRAVYRMSDPQIRQISFKLIFPQLFKNNGQKVAT